MSEFTKSSLRKLDFPDNVKEALTKIEQLCAPNVMPNSERIHNITQTDLAMDLISEFVFCEPDHRRVDKKNNGDKKKFTHVEELELLEVLSNYFAYNLNNMEGDAFRNTIFMLLFPNTKPDRCRILIKLVSISICTDNISLLSAAGVWMQQVGSMSQFSMELTKGLITDFFVLVPETITKLKDLPNKAPLFTANFLCALTEIYFSPGISDNPLIPGESVFNLLGDWICNADSLCYTALTSDLLHSLPTGGIPMSAITPFVGIFKWCVLAPLYMETEPAVISKLHFATLQSLHKISVYCAPTVPRNVLSTQHICSLIVICINRIEKLLDNMGLFKNATEEKFPLHVQLSLERFSQFIQGALYTQSTYGNKQELILRLRTVPSTRLLRIILAKYEEML